MCLDSNIPIWKVKGLNGIIYSRGTNLGITPFEKDIKTNLKKIKKLRDNTIDFKVFYANNLDKKIELEKYMTIF